MSKCMYTESDVTQTEATVMVTPISMDRKWDSFQQQKFKRAFSGAYDSVAMMVDPNFKKEEMKERPRLGDCIWLRTGGGKMVGFGIVREKHDDPIHAKALKAVFKNINAKAVSINSPYVGMDLYGCDTAQEWASIVGIIENCLVDTTAVVCIPNNEALQKVLEGLPGSNNFIKSEI